MARYPHHREGWQIIDDPPILFIRHSHQQTQVEPIRGGDAHRLFEFISVADEGARLLLLVWLVAAYIPGFPHPVPILHGPQGSGKSSTFRTLRRLIDPSATETLTFPRDINELTQKLAHHWAALFDNVAGLSGWQSDALCRAVTGEGFSKRQLYSNDEDVIYHFQRVIGLNGINVVATRADLLDRGILIGLERIPPEQRQDEEALEGAFKEARPYILGGIIDALVEALRIKPTIQLDRLPRMADFCKWSCAIAQALGYRQDAFLAAYSGNLHQQNAEVLEGHPVAAAILELMEERTEWEGEPAELLTVLEQVAEKKKINVRSKGWPGAANALSRRIREVKVNLQDAGIMVEDRHLKRRIISLRRVGNLSSAPSVSSAALSPNDLHADDIPAITDDTKNTVGLSSASKSLSHNGSDDTDDILHTQRGEDYARF